MQQDFVDKLLEATTRGGSRGSWVTYWSTGARVSNLNTSTSLSPTLHVAYAQKLVHPTTGDTWVVFCSFEHTQHPADVYCTASKNTRCSITNSRSLLGVALSAGIIVASSGAGGGAVGGGGGGGGDGTVAATPWLGKKLENASALPRDLCAPCPHTGASATHNTFSPTPCTQINAAHSYCSSTFQPRNTVPSLFARQQSNAQRKSPGVCLSYTPPHFSPHSLHRQRRTCAT